MTEPSTPDGRLVHLGKTREISDPVSCPWASCRCTHTQGCVAGWIEGAGFFANNGRWYDGPTARPCPTCRPEQAAILADRRSSWGERMNRLRKRGKAKGAATEAEQRAATQMTRPRYGDD